MAPKLKKKPQIQSAYLDEVGEIVQDVMGIGLQPILVGGMALVILGSRRVTRDFDFVVAQPDDLLDDLVAVFYKRGFELASRVDENGAVTTTIDNNRVAAARLKLDLPDSAYFVNPKTGLRIDLLFDFPLAAADLAKSAKKIKVRSRVFHVASEKDLIRLKEIAKSARNFPGDSQDLIFLRALKKK